MIKWFTLVFAVLLGSAIISADFGLLVDVHRWAEPLPAADKVAHFTLAGVISVLLNLTLRGRRVRLGPLTILGGNLALAIVGTIEETSQLWLVWRSFSWCDLAANYAGIFCFGRLATRACRRQAAADGYGEKS